MMPITEIHEGDQYSNPRLRPWGLEYVVVSVNVPEKMVLVQAVSPDLVKEIGTPFWKQNTNSMFSYDWRIFNMSDWRKDHEKERGPLGSSKDDLAL